MPEREKVIKGLEEVKHLIKFENLPAHSLKALLIMDDALALLKAQEPRVMTLEEIPYAVFGWIEYKSTDEVVPAVLEDVYGDNTVGCATLEDGHKYYDSNSYGRFWRCWDKEPTDEQREAIPWMT